MDETNEFWDPDRYDEEIVDLPQRDATQLFPQPLEQAGSHWRRLLIGDISRTSKLSQDVLDFVATYEKLEDLTLPLPREMWPQFCDLVMPQLRSLQRLFLVDGDNACGYGYQGLVLNDSDFVTRTVQEYNELVQKRDTEFPSHMANFAQDVFRTNRGSITQGDERALLKYLGFGEDVYICMLLPTDEALAIEESEARSMARRLAKEEGIFAVVEVGFLELEEEEVLRLSVLVVKVELGFLVLLDEVVFLLELEDVTFLLDVVEVVFLLLLVEVTFLLVLELVEVVFSLLLDEAGLLDEELFNTAVLLALTPAFFVLIVMTVFALELLVVLGLRVDEEVEEDEDGFFDDEEVVLEDLLEVVGLELVDDFVDEEVVVGLRVADVEVGFVVDELVVGLLLDELMVGLLLDELVVGLLLLLLDEIEVEGLMLLEEAVEAELVLLLEDNVEVERVLLDEEVELAED
ncbi:hypothetical protein KCU93_g1101, partial [Aureobasidium melanogenum]